MATTSPPLSPASNASPKSKGAQTPLSLDLSSLPPLITPSPPSNTLLITNLNSTDNFHPATLSKIKDLLSQPVPLNSFSPLRSLRRIIVSYPTTDAAIDMRQVLDGQSIGDDDRIRIYFGEHTPIIGEGREDHHLHPPSLGKLLFISPPPSPPLGWEIREEDPPNKDVHAEDLQKALASLNGFKCYDENAEDVDDGNTDGGDGRQAMSEEEKQGLEQFKHGGFGRKRSGTQGSLVVYHPRDHGDRVDLPAVMVEDTEGLGVVPEGGKMLTHTARPPVELMEQ